MRLIPASLSCLLLPLLMTVLPVTLSGCGGDRYSCDTCGTGGKGPNPDEDSEDPAEILPLTFIDAAQFKMLNTTDPTQSEDFDNYTEINLRTSSISEASATEYDEDATSANLAGIAGERWEDNVQTLAWKETTSSLKDGKPRPYYWLTTSGWELRSKLNDHELRRYDDKIYEFWLDVTLKWEIFEADDRLNTNGIAFPQIAGKSLDILRDAGFEPPIFADFYVRESVQLWGDNLRFADTADAEAKIYTVYKQFRPVLLDKKASTDTAVEQRGFVAFVPAPSISNGSAFQFQVKSTTTIPEFFRAEFAGDTSAARIPIIEGRLYISFVINGVAGAEGDGVMLWTDMQSIVPADVADFEEINSENGSYTVINLSPEQKATYGLETYENPMIAYIDDVANEVNIGAHVGWLYRVSGTLDVDKPRPHYAFNAAAMTDIKNAFYTWRRQTYCDDSTHNNDAGRATICTGL